MYMSFATFNIETELLDCWVNFILSSNCLAPNEKRSLNICADWFLLCSCFVNINEELLVLKCGVANYYFSVVTYKYTFGWLPNLFVDLICICSISKISMYNLLQPRLNVLLFEIVFPLMCFNDNDQKLWDEDPHEYVRKGYG